MSEILASSKKESFSSFEGSIISNVHSNEKNVGPVTSNSTIQNHHDAIPVGSNPPLGDLNIGDGYILSGTDDVYSTLYWRNLEERLSA